MGEVWEQDGVVVQHELASPELAALEREAEAGRARSGGVPGPAPSSGGVHPLTGTPAAHRSQDCPGLVPDLCRRFAAHLAGERVGYEDVSLDLSWATPFQAALAEAARAVPWGEVVSYGELAALAGRPGAARAAGAFCAENRFALVVPCHRVVAADGIGGYGPSGVGLKRRLLALEGLDL